MTLPALHLPKSAGYRLFWLPGQVTVRRLQAWTNPLQDRSLPERIALCRSRLAKLNRAYYPPKTRLALLSTLQGLLTDCFLSEKKLIRESRTLQQGRDSAVMQLDQLYAALADGYKLTIHNLAQETDLNEPESLLIQEAIYFALKYLARRLLLAYAQYLPEPKGVWRELHQIYRYADENALLFHIIDDPASDSTFPVFHSGDLIYKRMILVGLAEPYRLMQDECSELYNLASRWTSACTLFPLGRLSTRGEHVVDLADDQPPRFVTPDLSWQPVDGRVIDITEVVERLDKDLTALLNTDQLQGEFDLLELEERQKRDMLLRVINTFQGKPVRRSKRFSLSESIQFVSNITHCHLCLLKKKEFSPAKDELKYLSTTLKTKTDDASFARLYQKAIQDDQRLQRSDFHMHTAAQLNINPLGMAVEYQAGPNQNMAVGELIIYRLANKKQIRWQLGSVCWLKQVDDDACRFGIMNLANNPIPVAVKTATATADQRDYVRALLIPRHVSHQQVRSLVLPSLTYDVNSELILNLGRSLLYIRLTRMLASTPAFAQFEYEVKQRSLAYLLE